MNIYKIQFEIKNKTPDCWHNKSRDLLASARILWDAIQSKKELEVSCWKSCKMLMGMSFELLFKAHCIGKDIDFDATHDLVSLARAANLTTSKDENEVLKVLSEYVVWDGRYPTPRKFQYLENHWKNQSKVQNNKVKAENLTMMVQNDKLNFEKLMPIWRKFSDSFMAMDI